ncbi:MAG TPA: tetratricopeptide repeat protein [Candidatus Acidoferrum sp.]|nr:tetratricopeptide repeat protein [Candidatus Acidoferrum sp.]
MAYNKSKFVEAAQKLLNQGKVAQAIAEYQQVLKFEPRDQVTLMTVGELYIRQGETFQAIDYFERLAQIFVGDGFLTKAIAVYKRIAKLAPEEIRPLEKLADLYVQQGVMSEARPLFLQLAEIHLKHNRQPEAVSLLKRLLIAEPDNLRIQVRLADLYQAMGLSKEAVDSYVSAAQRALARGDQPECEKLADKALKIDPQNLAAVIVKARSYSARGNVTQAAELLEHVPDLEKGGEQAELLLDLHIKNVNWDKATALALRIFEADEKNFGLTQKVAEALLQSGQGEQAMAIIERTRIPMLDAGEHEAVSNLLNELVVRLPGRVEPHEWLVDSYGRTSDSFRLPDALAQLGDALVANGQMDRAKGVFQQLVEREPESESAKRKLNGLLQKMGMPVPEATEPFADNLKAELQPPPAPKIRPDLPAPVVAPESEPVSHAVTERGEVASSLDEDTQKFITQSLTDVDLFASYGLTQKAIGLLEAILRRAPRHTPTLEKLLDFVLTAADDRRTTELAARLEKLHTERGDQRSAERFGELRRRFQRSAGITDDELAAACDAALTERSQIPAESADVDSDEFPTFEIASEPVAGENVSEPVLELSSPAPVEAASQHSGSDPLDVHEVDLSEEWLSVLKEVEPGHPGAVNAGAHAVTHANDPTAHQTDAHKTVADETAVPVESSAAPVEFEIAAEPIPAEDDVDASSAQGVLESPFVPPPDMPAYAEFQVSAPEIPTETSEPATTALHEAQISAAPDTPVEEIPLPEEISLPEPAAEEVAPPAEEKVPKSAAVEQSHEPAKTSEPEPESEFELQQDYDLILEPEELVPAHSQKPPDIPVEVHAAESDANPEHEHVGRNSAGPPAGSDFASDHFLADLASEIEDLGMGGLTPSYSKAATEAPIKNIDKSNLSDSGPLKEVFDEFRAELGEMGSDDEDLETHYNLGTAFREMGLLEEAISEFQKVAKANERGRPFRYAMQCCTLLGLAFMEKGQPGIAAIWYERALETPGVEPESILALRYDLGIAQESAGEPEAALKSFSKVYAMNIDYRDVAERIAALQKPSR